MAVSDKDPLKRGASFECRLVKGNAGGTLRYEQWPRSRQIYPGGYGGVKTIDDCLDPERAYELLPGKTRSSTLKRYVTMFSWMEKAAGFGGASRYRRTVGLGSQR